MRTRAPVQRSGSATRWVLTGTESSGGTPGPVLVAESRDAQLLVIGTQEHTGLRRAVLGSVSHYCLSHARAPVVAIPLADRARDEAPVYRDAFATPGPLL